jgi:hypothetical protein
MKEGYANKSFEPMNKKSNRIEAAGLRLPPLPHHPACGSAPGGSSSIQAGGGFPP